MKHFPKREITLSSLKRPREDFDESLYRREAERTSVTAVVSDQTIGIGVRGSF